MPSPYKNLEHDSYVAGWDIWNEMSADNILGSCNSLTEARKRSQQLVRDNPIVAGFLETYQNVISGSGPTIYVESLNRIQEKQAQKITDDWLEFCDMSRTRSFENRIEESITSAFTDGDVLINLPLDKKSKGIKTVNELVEAYRIETPHDKFTNPNIRHGVEYDPEGRIKGYWVKKLDTTGSSKTYTSETGYTFYPMFNEGRMVTYLFKAPYHARCTASRQIPIMTPLFRKLKQFDDYYEALIIGARVAACFSAFIVSKNPTLAVNTLSTGPNGEQLQTDGRKYTKLQPGMIFYLRQGEEPNFATPNRPGDNADAFLVRSCKLMSMACRIPYIIGFLDTDEVSYSSWRGAVLDTYKMIGRWRREFNKVTKWNLQTVLYEAILNGYIRGNLEDIIIKTRWPSSGILDAEKEARGNRIDLENRTQSRTNMIDEQGRDYDVINEELTREAINEVERLAEVLVRQKELEEEKGIIFPENKDKDGKKVDQENSEETVDARKEDGNW